MIPVEQKETYKGSVVPDTRPALDPSTGIPIEVIKNGISGGKLTDTDVKPVTFTEKPGEKVIGES